MVCITAVQFGRLSATKLPIAVAVSAKAITSILSYLLVLLSTCFANFLHILIILLGLQGICLHCALLTKRKSRFLLLLLCSTVILSMLNSEFSVMLSTKFLMSLMFFIFVSSSLIIFQLVFQRMLHVYQ